MRKSADKEAEDRLKQLVSQIRRRKQNVVPAWPILALATVVFLLPATAQSQPATTRPPAPRAAPTAPPIAVQPAPPPRVTADALIRPAGLTLYSIGDPTDEEQLYLEYVNRARANPAAEAGRLRNTTDPDVINACAYFGVDFDLMVQQMSALAATPPLSLNPLLTTAARLHSLDMLTNNYQGHTGSDGSSPVSRVQEQGYAWSALGENVFATATEVFHGHAGFEVDWGFGVGGMQTPAGHRINIHSAAYREIGIGVINGRNAGVGPQLVTQEFCSQFGLKPFITGVVYYDLNTNGFYDAGEGVGGVTVNVSGSTFFAVTANSGGFSVPVPGSGAYLVTFAAPGLSGTQMVAAVISGANVKLDYVPAYAPPVISGPDSPVVGAPHDYTFTPVGGANGYQWKQMKRIPYTLVEGAESGLSNVSATTTPGYSVVDNEISASGNNSFHLCHSQPADQFLTLNHLLRPSVGCQFIFAGRLGYATPNQVARAQISTDSGASWIDLWSKAGNTTPGEPTFTRVTNSLNAYAGREVQLRFVYDHTGGSYFNQTTRGVGFYVDDITVTGAEELVAATTNDTATTTFAFAPPDAGNYTLRVRARLGNHLLAWGPPFSISAPTEIAPTRVRLAGPPTLSNGRVLLNATVLSGNASSFQVEIAPNPGGPWTVDQSATVETVVPGLRLRANASPGQDGRRLYRIVPR